MKKVISTTNAPGAIGPYSQGTEINGMVFTSGQIAIDPSTGNLIDGGVEEEAHMVMKNLSAVLEAAGTNFDHVVKTGIFLADMDDFAKVNAVYESYLSEGTGYPARETVQVAKLPKGVKVEISMIAVK